MIIFYNVRKNELSNAVAAMNLLQDCLRYEFAETNEDNIKLYLTCKVHRKLTKQEINLLKLYGNYWEE